MRADRFNDTTEGLPPEDYHRVLGLHPLDINDARQLRHSIGSLAQFREAFYVNCWYLFEEESAAMWKGYADHGVAICSRYEHLKAALVGMNGRPHLGLVRYGFAHLTGWNTQRFISTKQQKYAHEKEVRAALWISDPFPGINRHFDADNRVYDRPLTPPPADRVPDGVTRHVDVASLVNGVVTSPWISEENAAAVTKELKEANLNIPVRESDLVRYVAFLP